jgi:CRISPR-associated protein Cas1
MLNEFVYCPRLFYHEFVEGVFVESADTLRGSSLHRRVDAGAGGLPPAATPGAAKAEGEGEVIHSRSVQMASERLGVTAKLDLVEVRTGAEDLLEAIEVCPVDYKAGAPRASDEGAELWDTDKMQLGLQVLILRDNGYACREGMVYYRATKQRVRLPVTPELEGWIIGQLAAARAVAAGPMPAPLADSPRCPRCSLAPVCLPDETRLLGTPPAEREAPASVSPAVTAPRRLMAPRDDRRALYLNTQGLRVGRKDELLQVKQEQALLDEVRLNDVSHVALFGNIQLSTQAVQALCEAEVPVTYFSMGGWFYGITRGHELKNVFLRLEQFRLARNAEACLRLARQFVHGKIRNHRTMLMRNHLEPPPATLLKLKQAADAALRAPTVEALLGIEGGAASAYFEQFSGMLKVADALAEAVEPPRESSPVQTTFNFNFTHRNRRPPTDPVNALLSLAYSLLAKDCLLAALAVGFDPYVGFFHQPRFGRPALALDLMEEFRPLVAESTVLSCINNRVITTADFVRAGHAVNLAAAARKRFFQTYEQRTSSLLTHPLFDYKVSYRRALELQARLLAKNLTGEIPEYVPLMTR